MEFGTCPTGWHIEGDRPNQVAALAQVPLYNTVYREERVEKSATLSHNYSPELAEGYIELH